jgi:CRP-like cAMP-binding protein
MYKKTKGTYTLRRLFPTLKEEEIVYLQQHSSVIRLKKGQNLFLSGDKPRSIYGVAHGCLKIMIETQDGDAVITRIVQSGSILGIREVFSDSYYTRTSVALKDSEVFSIESHSVFILIQKNPSVAFQFMKIFCSELARMERRIESDLYRTAKARVAAVLFDLFFLFAESEKRWFNIPLNRRDIAALADVTPETVSRSLAELKQSGLLETKGSSFNITDLNLFRQEAEG